MLWWGAVVCERRRRRYHCRARNVALRRFDILLIVPVYQTFWILSGTMAGLIYFKECAASYCRPCPVVPCLGGVRTHTVAQLVGVCGAGVGSSPPHRASH